MLVRCYQVVKEIPLVDYPVNVPTSYLTFIASNRH